MTTFEFGGRQYTIPDKMEYKSKDRETNPLLYVYKTLEYEETAWDEFLSKNKEHINKLLNYNLSNTLLGLACRLNNIALTKQLIKYGADPNIICTDGHSILFHVCNTGNEINYNIVKILLDAGAFPNAYSKTGKTLLYLACTRTEPNSENIIKLLIEKGARVNDYAEDSSSFLQVCNKIDTFNDPIGMVKLFLDSGVDVNFRESVEGNTALWNLCECLEKNKKNIEIFAYIVKMFIKAGVKLNLTDKIGQTFLTRLRRNQKFKLNRIISLVLINGANPNVKCPYTETTPLIEILNTEVIIYVNSEEEGLRKGTKLNQRRNELIKMLLDTDINLNIKCQDKTQLEYLCIKADEEIIKYCFDKHLQTYETIQKCILLGKHVKLLKSYAHKLLYQKIGYFPEKIDFNSVY